VSYPDLVRLAGGVPVHPEAGLETGYKMTPEAFEAAVSSRTRAVIFNSPCNPTGHAYTRAEAMDLAGVALKHNLLVISDEIYDRILYDNSRHVSFAALSPEMKERTFTINGVSKAYAMTGWRIGFAAGPADVIHAMGLFQAQATGNPSSVSQAAALAALTGDGPEIEHMVRAYSRRREIVLEELTETRYVEWRAPMGAFYFFVRVREALGRRLEGRTVDTVDDLATLLMDRGVGVVPGTGFGAPDAIRLSFAAADDDIRKGLGIIRETLSRMR
jgi:aspartate aminotransferase